MLPAKATVLADSLFRSFWHGSSCWLLLEWGMEAEAPFSGTIGVGSTASSSFTGMKKRKGKHGSIPFLGIKSIFTYLGNFCKVSLMEMLIPLKPNRIKPSASAEIEQSFQMVLKQKRGTKGFIVTPFLKSSQILNIKCQF
uniref:Uncharacterized protein n=1 Tax=Micrurus surinamensis TaxID=129470 RepID=A0A2D4Q695_MICSU